MAWAVCRKKSNPLPSLRTQGYILNLSPSFLACPGHGVSDHNGIIWWLIPSHLTKNTLVAGMPCARHHRSSALSSPGCPLNTWRNNNVVITPKRRHFGVITSKWHRFAVITTSLLCNVFAGWLRLGVSRIIGLQGETREKQLLKERVPKKK